MAVPLQWTMNNFFNAPPCAPHPLPTRARTRKRIHAHARTHAHETRTHAHETRTHAHETRTHARTHARTHTRTHAHTQTLSLTHARHGHSERARRAITECAFSFTLFYCRLLLRGSVFWAASDIGWVVGAPPESTNAQPCIGPSISQTTHMMNVPIARRRFPSRLASSYRSALHACEHSGSAASRRTLTHAAVYSTYSICSHGASLLRRADETTPAGHSYMVYGPLLNGCTSVIYEGKPVKPPARSVLLRDGARLSEVSATLGRKARIAPALFCAARLPASLPSASS
eukprot:6172166-Pleurochrysis_carterae.AAC.1